MVLLDFWYRYGCGHFNCSIEVAHVDHALRADSHNDLILVRERCHKLGVPFHYKKLNPQTQKAGESMEMWARESRYQYFNNICRQGGMHWLLTAHHKDDQAETILQRLGRGTGPRGLRGILFYRTPDIIRPLLNRSKAELRNYAGKQKLKWSEDNTNSDISIERNWYRHVFMPRLSLKEPDYQNRFFRISETMQRVWPLIQDLLTEGISGENIMSLPRTFVAYWLKKDPSYLYYPLQIMAGKLKLDFPEGVFREFLRQITLPSCVNCVVAVNSSTYIKYDNEGLSFRNSSSSSIQFSQFSLVAPSQGVVTWNWGDAACKMTAKIYQRPQAFDVPKTKEYRVFLDARDISSTLLIRTRRRGDRFAPLGLPSKNRKLKVFFIGIKLPREKRDKQLLVCFKNEIIWAPGLEISDFYKVTSQTKKILELSIKCPKL